MAFAVFAVFLLVAIVAGVLAYAATPQMVREDSLGGPARAPFRNPVPAALIGFLILILGIFAATSVVIVPFGQVRIVTLNGALTNRVLGPGLNFKWPLINGTYSVNTQMRAVRVTGDSVFTRDQQNADNDYVLNFSLDDSKLNDIVSQFKGPGSDTSISERLIEPRASFWLKQIEPNYNAAVLLQKRADVAAMLQSDLDKDLKPYGVRLAFVSITNVSFGPKYQEASEARAAAEQEFQREKTVLNTKRVLAQQEIALADGDRRAEELRRNGLGTDPRIAADIVSLTFIEHMTKDNGWDGRVPQMLGGGGAGLISLDPGAQK